MSKYNLSELLTEVAGGRIGTLEISARDLVRKMEDLEDKGVRVDRFDGLSPDGKTYIEFHVHPMRKYDEDQSFSVYDYKFGFDPMSPEHVDVEYPFSIGGRSAARDSAETVLRSGAMGFDPIFEEKEEIKEDKEKDLINALRFQIMTLEKGIIDKDDFINAVEELAFGQRRGPMGNPSIEFTPGERIQEEEVDEVMGIDRKGRKKSDYKSNLTNIDEADKMEIVSLLNDIRKHLNDKFDRKYSQPEFNLYMESLKNDIKRGEFDEVKSMSMEDHEENFENYIADRYDDLREEFSRFM